MPADSAAADPPAQRPHRWELFTDRKLRRLRRNQICNVLFLLEYAARYCAPGILWDTDADIAAGIGLELEPFQALIDLLTPRQMVRAVLVEGVRWYEFSRDLEPLYKGDRRHFEDNWDSPTPRLTPPSEARSVPAFSQERNGADGGTEKWKGNRRYQITDLSQYEKNQFGEARRNAGDYGLPEPNRDAWITKFRARRQAASTAPEIIPSEVDSNPVNDILAGDFQGDSHPDVRPISSSMDSSYVRKKPTTNSTLGGDSHPESNPPESNLESNLPNASGESNLSESGTSAIGQEQPFTQEQKNAVYRYLHHEEAIWQAPARVAVGWCDMDTARMYLYWAKTINKEGEPVGALVAKWLNEQTPIPPEIRKRYRAAETEAQRKAQQEQATQQKAAQTDAILARIEQYWNEMSDEDRVAALYQAANNLIGQQRGWWREFLEHRKTYAAAKPPLPLDAVLHRQLDDVLRDRLQLSRLDKGQIPPARFVMPPEWDGALPEPGELPPDLGIPDLS